MKPDPQSRSRFASGIWNRSGFSTSGGASTHAGVCQTTELWPYNTLSLGSSLVHEIQIKTCRCSIRKIRMIIHFFFERLWSLQSPNTLWNPFLRVGTSLNSTTCFLSWIDLPLQAPLQLFAIPGPLVTPNLQTVTVCQGLRQSHCDNRTYQSISYCCWPKSLENPSQQPQHHVQAAATVRHRHHPESRSDWIEGGPGDVTVRMCNWI